MSEGVGKKVNLEFWQLFNKDGDIVRFESLRGVFPKGKDEIVQVVLKSDFEQLKKQISDMKEMHDFGWKCYQDRCEGAYIESSVVKKLEKEKAELIEVLSDMNNWLKRMSCLQWDDPNYAPRFKKSCERNEQVLSKLGDGGNGN